MPPRVQIPLRSCGLRSLRNRLEYIRDRSDRSETLSVLRRPLPDQAPTGCHSRPHGPDRRAPGSTAAGVVLLSRPCCLSGWESRYAAATSKVSGKLVKIDLAASTWSRPAATPIAVISMMCCRLGTRGVGRHKTELVDPTPGLDSEDLG